MLALSSFGYVHVILEKGLKTKNKGFGRVVEPVKVWPRVSIIGEL